MYVSCIVTGVLQRGLPGGHHLSKPTFHCLLPGLGQRCLALPLFIVLNSTFVLHLRCFACAHLSAQMWLTNRIRAQTQPQVTPTFLCARLPLFSLVATAPQEAVWAIATFSILQNRIDALFSAIAKCKATTCFGSRRPQEAFPLLYLCKRCYPPCGYCKAPWAM
jgi:hypothetical protein